MLTKIRYKLSIYLVKKADELIKTGEFKKVMKGLDYFKWSLMLIPPSDELRKTARQLKEIAENERANLLKE